MSEQATPLRIAKCFACDSTPKSMCRHCGQEFCDQHKSRYDSHFCSNCIGDENTSLVEAPLVDDEGVEHKGRQLKLIGEGWPNLLEMIHNLTEQELEQKLGQWKSLLKQAMITNEFYRITVSAAEFEKEERRDSRRRRLEDRREALKAQGTSRLNGKASTRTTADPAVKLSKDLGIPIKQARKLIEITNQMKAGK